MFDKVSDNVIFFQKKFSIILIAIPENFTRMIMPQINVTNFLSRPSP